MRVRLSVTLPDELLVKIDYADRNRAHFIETAVRAYLASLETRRDIDILNANAERLNAEAADVLEYQGRP